MPPWKRGQSGNPGGRPAIAKAWEAATGKTTTQVTAEALKLIWDVATRGPGTSGINGDPNDPNWRFAMQKVLEYSAGKPKETVELLDGDKRPRDWKAVPLERRRALLAALTELREVTDEQPEPTGTDEPTEH